MKQLEEKHKQLAEEIINGTPRREIAEKLNINRNTIYLWMRDELWQAYFSKLVEEQDMARLQRLVPITFLAAEVATQALQNLLEDLQQRKPGAPRIGTVVDALKKIVELERGDRRRIPEKSDDLVTEDLSPRAQRLLKSLDDMVRTETSQLVELEQREPN